MATFTHPGAAGQGIDPPAKVSRPRADTLKLSPEEAQRVRVAIVKIARASGGFVALAVKLGVSTNTVYHSANPKRRPSLAFAVRLAAVAKVPVDALLSGKLAVQPAVIGVAA